MSQPQSREAEGLQALIATLQSEAGLEKPRPAPPVHMWNPEHCGDIGLEILKDGVWRQNGVRFTREKLVRLFSTILRRDADGFYLVTPHEKVVVKVHDAPFIVTRVDRTEADSGASLVVTTNVGDVVVIGPDHPLEVRVDEDSGEPGAYVTVRGGLEARLCRPAWYELVSWAEESPDGRMRVRSMGETYSLGSIS
ncbi:MAG: DUF1285 domain-containing protein [Hyphomonadaceae bacterium]